MRLARRPKAAASATIMNSAVVSQRCAEHVGEDIDTLAAAVRRIKAKHTPYRL
jgi:hypothetical protein